MKAVTLDQSLLKDTKSGESNHSYPTSTGGVFNNLSPLKKMYETYQEKLLDDCNQRLMCCDQKIEELSQQLRKAKKEKIEVYKIMKAIKEVK